MNFLLTQSRESQISKEEQNEGMLRKITKGFTLLQ